MDLAARQELSTWMARLADGDREPLHATLVRLLPELRRFTAAVLRDPADADDAAQRALVSVFARAHDYEAGRDALAWAIGIAAWECRTTLRTRARRRDCATMPEVADDAVTPETAMIDRDLHAAIHVAVGVLSADDRAALGLDDSDPTLAPGTLRKRRQRALMRLREAWNRIHGTR